MIILLMVLLICCIKTVMVCRRQKRVNDQRRRIMQRQAEANHQGEPRLFTIHQSFQLPGGQMPPMFLPEDMYRNWWKFSQIKEKQCLRIEPRPLVWNFTPKLKMWWTSSLWSSYWSPTKLWFSNNLKRCPKSRCIRRRIRSKFAYWNCS